MTERLQIVLVVCISTLGALSVGGIVITEVSSRQVEGFLPSIATGCLVALAGLITVMGQNARQARMETKLDTIHESTNGRLSEVKKELKDAMLTIRTMQIARDEREDVSDKLATQRSKERQASDFPGTPPPGPTEPFTTTEPR